MNLLAKSAAAKHFGVSPATITRALGGPLAPALVGARIDVDHPKAVEWANVAKERARLDAERKAAKQASPEVTDPEPLPADVPEFLRAEGQPIVSELQSMTLRDVVLRFGTLPQYADHLKAYATLCDAAKKELSVHEAKGRVISRELVEQTTFSHIEALHMNLLRDTAATLALRVAAMVRSGATPVELLAHIRGEIGSQLRRTKDSVAKSLCHRAIRQATQAIEAETA